jgi:signal peptidase I
MSELVRDTLPAPPRPRLRRQTFLREVAETLILIGAIYALVNLATVRYFIDGPSMQPSFVAGQFLVVSRISYLVSDPERGDVVVFNAPGNDADDPPLIKRLIGLPNDTIEIRNTQVYINGTPIEEPYIKEACRENRCRDEVWELGAEDFFLMGDNRNNSRDSRVFGVVNRSRVIGEALIRYWPPSVWGIVDHFRYPVEEESVNPAPAE